MSADPLPNPKTAIAPQGSQNGDVKLPAGALDRAMFATFVEQREREPEPETKVSPTAEAKDAPEQPEQPTEQEEPAKETLPEDEPKAEGDEPKTEEADETDLSQTDDKKLAEALKGINADGRKHLLEMVKAVESGETTLGQLKRQLKLGRAENEELQNLRKEVEQLKSNPPVASEAKDIPPTVAKLKTAAEVEARSELAETSIRAIEDFLEENPQGGAIGEKEFTRAELIARKRAFQDELKVLPKQAQAIQQQAQFEKTKVEVRAKTVQDFPVLQDPEHPDTKTAQQFIKANPFMGLFPNQDYLALALARGHRELQTELAARTKGKAGQRPVAKPTGTVPAGKPHSAGTAPARTAPSGAPVGDLLKAVKDKESFAEMLAATGR